MPLRVNNNITAITARRALGVNSRTLATRIERLSTGLRINRAADDVAGLSPLICSSKLKACLCSFSISILVVKYANTLGFCSNSISNFAFPEPSTLNCNKIYVPYLFSKRF